MKPIRAREEQAIRKVYAALGPIRLRYCPLTATARQELFMRLPHKEAFHGGGAGSGKSIALLMSGLQYADVPGYHALVLRPSISELQLPGGLIQIGHDWLAPTEASWNGDQRQWVFASGATLTFGYLDSDGDVRRYLGTSYSFLGFDELTSFTETNYLRMFRVLRQPSTVGSNDLAAPDGTRLADVLPRVRSASNPGGPGHSWVKTRFVDPTSRAPGAAFIAAKPADNPHLDLATYRETLANLPHAERERLLHGDWEIPDDGELFRREWLEIIDPVQLPPTERKVRFWDLASTAPGPTNRDPDYTCGLRLEVSADGIFYITDVVLARQAPGAIEQLVAQTAREDGREVTIVIEQEPGAAGKSLAARYTRDILRGYTAYTRPASGSKIIRAHPVAAAAENGYLKLVRGRNTTEFLDQLTAFPNGAHDDCVDALAGAHTHLPKHHGGMKSFVPQGRIPTPDYARPGWQRALDLDTLAATIGIPIYDPKRWNL